MERWSSGVMECSIQSTVLLHSSDAPILWSSSLDEAFKTRNRLSIPLIALGQKFLCKRE
jgi:hypothetical protein